MPEAAPPALGEGHPLHTGFDKDGLLGILKDENVFKLVNRVDGKISTLCFFVQDFKHYPWFNTKYYEDKYPDYFKSSNILIFPGIVTDEEMRGNDYSQDVFLLAARMLAKRGSNVLATFECTEKSALYIPKILATALNYSGVAHIENVETPISSTDYLVAS